MINRQIKHLGCINSVVTWLLSQRFRLHLHFVAIGLNIPFTRRQKKKETVSVKRSLGLYIWSSALLD